MLKSLLSLSRGNLSGCHIQVRLELAVASRPGQMALLTHGRRSIRAGATRATKLLTTRLGGNLGSADRRRKRLIREALTMHQRFGLSVCRI